MPKAPIMAAVDSDVLRGFFFDTGSTINELADKAGLSHLTLQNVVRGKAVTPKTIKKIADAMKMKPRDILAAE